LTGAVVVPILGDVVLLLLGDGLGEELVVVLGLDVTLGDAAGALDVAAYAYCAVGATKTRKWWVMSSPITKSTSASTAMAPTILQNMEILRFCDGLPVLME
jgi:hypothetical protein